MESSAHFFISGWEKLIEQGVQASMHPLPCQLSKPELQRNNLKDCDAATRAILIGGCDEFLLTLKGPPDPLGKVAPNALASGDDGKTDPVLETRTSLFRDMAGFLASVMPLRGPLLWLTRMSASSRRPDDPG